MIVALGTDLWHRLKIVNSDVWIYYRLEAGRYHVLDVFTRLLNECGPLTLYPGKCGVSLLVRMFRSVSKARALNCWHEKCSGSLSLLHSRLKAGYFTKRQMV